MESTNKLLILDLDETLIHASRAAAVDEAGALVPVAFEVGPYAVRVRPGCAQFLSFCFAQFAAVAVWTVGNRSYADEVCAALFGERLDELAFVWARDRCTRQFDAEYYEHYYVKNLLKVKKRWPLAQVIMVDNTPRKLERQYGNLVAIRDFEGAADDVELARLQRYLVDLAQVPNVRAVEKRGWWQRY